MTPQDWKEVEAKLGTPYGRARLRADGHVITLAVERGKGLRYVVAAYIDGRIEWQKCSRPEPDAIERKFWRARFHYLYSAAQRAKAAAGAKKRGMPADIKAILQSLAEAGFEMLDPSFTSGKAACSHLRKHCTTVERLPDFDDFPVPEVAR